MLVKSYSLSNPMMTSLSTSFRGSACLFVFMLAITLLQNLNHNCFIRASPIWHGGTDVVSFTIETGSESRLREEFQNENHKPFLPLKHEIVKREVADKLQILLNGIKPLGNDQSVTSSAEEYTERARTFASKNGKVFILDAWKEATINDAAAVPASPNDRPIEAYMLFAFAYKAKGNFYVVGKPKSAESPDQESQLVFKLILPDLQKNPNVLALIIVNPDNFKDTRKIPCKPPKTVSGSQASAEVDSNELLSEVPTGEEGGENPTGLNSNPLVDDRTT